MSMSVSPFIEYSKSQHGGYWHNDVTGKAPRYQQQQECGRTWPSPGGDINEAGCSEFVLNWLHRTGDILFVLGYCVLAFVKLCFVAILRYELREMVQKIKILQTEMVQPMHEMTGILAMSTASYNPLAGQSRPVPAVVATRAESVCGSLAELTPQTSPAVFQPPQQRTLASTCTANGDVPTGSGVSGGGGASTSDAYFQFQTANANGVNGGNSADRRDDEQSSSLFLTGDYQLNSTNSRYANQRTQLSNYTRRETQ